MCKATGVSLSMRANSRLGLRQVLPLPNCFDRSATGCLDTPINMRLFAASQRDPFVTVALITIAIFWPLSVLNRQKLPPLLSTHSPLIHSLCSTRTQIQINMDANCSMTPSHTLYSEETVLTAIKYYYNSEQPCAGFFSLIMRHKPLFPPCFRFPHQSSRKFKCQQVRRHIASACYPPGVRQVLLRKIATHVFGYFHPIP